MILKPEQAASLAEAAKPLIKWLNENCHPHCEAAVTVDSVEIHELVARQKNAEFIKD